LPLRKGHQDAGPVLLRHRKIQGDRRLPEQIIQRHSRRQGVYKKRVQAERSEGGFTGLHAGTKAFLQQGEAIAQRRLPMVDQYPVDLQRPALFRTIAEALCQCQCQLAEGIANIILTGLGVMNAAIEYKRKSGIRR